MRYRVVKTNKRLAVERQIHAAIAHFREGNFECVITLCSAAEGRIPEPAEPVHLFGRLKEGSAANPPTDGTKDDFNYHANWLKHNNEPDDWEIAELDVKLWLNRAISKYRAIYGVGTREMAAVFPWAGTPTRARRSTQ